MRRSLFSCLIGLSPLGFLLYRQLVLSNRIFVSTDEHNEAVELDWSCWNNTNSSATDHSCRANLIAALSRIWGANGRPAFCKDPTDTLSLIKVPKSGSSTLAGLLLRLEAKTHCRVDWEHGNARDKEKALWNIAPVRHPDARALSSVYYHQISFHQRKAPSPSLAFLRQHLLRIPGNYVFDYTRFDTNEDIIASLVRILDTYDMLLVVDRLDESIVVLSILLQLPVKFFLANSAKQAGSWYHVRPNRCIRLHTASANLRQSVNVHVFQSSEWQRRHFMDHFLYEIANQSLTQTIAYHQKEFDERYAEYQDYQQQIEAKCSNQDVFPCSFNGTSQLTVSSENCYLRDFGCGYPCIDRIVG